MVYGLLNVFKPSGPTSHDIVAGVRLGTGERRVGHAGTLDPMADGVLVIALGKATRLVEYLAPEPKEYHAQITLGITTDTYDIFGQQVTGPGDSSRITRQDIDSVLAQFVGPINQYPPIYSAIKVKGKPAYKRARAGEDFRLDPRSVTIFSLNCRSFDPPLVEISVTCSAGTYIRSLAHDVGQALACGAALSKLRRVACGAFTLADSVPWESLNHAFENSSWEQYVVPADQAVMSLPAMTVDQHALADIFHGRPFKFAAAANGVARAYAPTGELVAILVARPEDGLWHPHKVLREADELQEHTSM